MDLSDSPPIEALTGCLLGTAVGDALGLPYEGLRRGRVARWFQPLGAHHLLLGRGLVSDDTEHACFVAGALIASQSDPERFTRSLAWRLRWWLLGVPAGIGLATLRATLRLWVGVPPARSGVWSAGNGPAMRAPLLGVALGGDLARLRAYVRHSTVLTHRDPKAYYGALAVAVAAHLSARGHELLPEEYLVAVRAALAGESAEDFLALMHGACTSAAAGEPLATYVATIGCADGISGYMYHTVPAVVHTWLRHQGDFRGGIEELIAAGGDTDSTAAILGGILGARGTRADIPPAWLAGIAEWPRSTAWMTRLGAALADALADPAHGREPGLFVPGIVLRNALLVAVVLMHAARRALPPY